MLTVIKQLLLYMRSYKLLTSAYFFLFALDLTFISLAPLSFKFMIDYAVEPGDMNAFILILLILGIVGVLCTAAGVASDYILAKLNARVEQDLRAQLFEQLQHLKIQYFHKRRSGELVSLFSVDLPAIDRMMVALLTTGMQSFAVVVVSTIVLFYLEWSMAIVILIGAAAIYLGPYLLGKRAQAVYAQYKEQLAAMTSDVQENVKAQKVIKGFNLQSTMIDRFNTRLKSMFLSSYHLNLMEAKLGRIPMISLLIVNFAIIGIGSYLALQGQITVGSLVAFISMYTSMGNSVYSLTSTIPMMTNAQVSMERIHQVLNHPRETVENHEAFKFKLEDQLDLKACQITFGYNEGEHVLEHISLNVPRGTTAAFVGSSGSGKSTMLQLLLGFYPPNEGQITINGIKLQDLNIESYREKLGIVFQDNVLFQGTLLDNIRLSKPDASFEEVVAAARQAEIHDYIRSLPDGYETEVLDEGSNFSGGQRQRLAIARAILRNPSILFLDEATSALDPVSEAAINQTFAKLAADRTVISVTHRLATVTEFDQIFVFGEGKLLEGGSHRELLQKGGYYKQLWDKQSGLSLADSGQEAAIDAERLSRLPFFQGVDHHVLGEVTQLFNTETFDAGQSIIREGESGEKFYLIVRGSVEVTKVDPNADTGRTRVAVLEDGDHFGEIALLENVPRTATITAMTPCVMLTLQRKVLHYILSQYPDINAYVRQTLIDRQK